MLEIQNKSLYNLLLLEKYKLLKKAINELEVIKIKVEGESMLPTIKPEEVVYIASIHHYSPRVGDILLYVSKLGNLVLHRIINIKNEIFYMKGDNEDYIDEIQFNQIIGFMDMSNKENIIKITKIFESQIGKFKIQIKINKGEFTKVQLEEM